MRHFEYKQVFTVEEAYTEFSNSTGSSYYLAGGTDLFVKIKDGVLKPQRLIDIKGIPQMEGISVSNGTLSIGALTLIRALEISSEVKEWAPLLAQSAAKLGSVQVRNKATIGGNLCNAAPSADMAPALLALDAQVEIFGKGGQRVVNLRDLFSAPGITSLKAGEILISLKIPLRQASWQGTVYKKLTTRKAMDIAFVGVAVLLEIDTDDCISRARIALGAVASTPIRVTSAETVLEGNIPNEDLFRESAALAAASTSPISDLRASIEYRREMVHQLCQDALLTAYNHARNMKKAELT